MASEMCGLPSAIADLLSERVVHRYALHCTAPISEPMGTHQNHGLVDGLASGPTLKQRSEVDIHDIRERIERERIGLPADRRRDHRDARTGLGATNKLKSSPANSLQFFGDVVTDGTLQTGRIRGLRSPSLLDLNHQPPRSGDHSAALYRLAEGSGLRGTAICETSVGHSAALTPYRRS